MALGDQSFDDEQAGRAGGGGAEGITTDTLLRGRVILLQPVHGFRSSLDPVLLAAFVKPPFGRFVDIGCGTGALAFLLAATDDAATGVGVELQTRLASLARSGLARNAFKDRMAIVEADVRTAVGHPPLVPAAYDLVVTNPPYRPISDGVLSPHPERARANHEVTLRLDEWLDAALTLVHARGRLAVIYPAERVQALLSGLERRGFVASRIRLVHPRRDRPAARVLIEATPRAGSTTTPPFAAAALAHTAAVEPPLVVHQPDGGFTLEVRQMLGEPPDSAASDDES